MANSDYSQLLTKMAELRSLTAQYKELTQSYTPALSSTATPSSNADVYTQEDNKNGMSNTATPLVTRPGEDYGQYWKYVGKIDPSSEQSEPENNVNKNSQICWNKAANDPRLFKTVVYTGHRELGSNPSQPEWNNRCYALLHDAPPEMSFNTPSNGYTIMRGRGGSGNSGVYYTKLGINSPTDNANIYKASQLKDIQVRVNSLTREISALSNTGITSELNDLIGSSTDASALISKINYYMNTTAADISSNYYLSDKRKEMNNVYSEINEQRTLRTRKFRFIFYIIITIMMIIGYASYTSKSTLLEQIDTIRNYIGWGWWTTWWIIAVVVLVFIISSYGWDARGNIMMIIRYITDPEFWTGQLWWVGVTFLMLIVIFLHATFKSFFVEFEAGMKGIQASLDGEGGGGGGGE
jgi:hypothetical protein